MELVFAWLCVCLYVYVCARARALAFEAKAVVLGAFFCVRGVFLPPLPMGDPPPFRACAQYPAGSFGIGIIGFASETNAVRVCWLAVGVRSRVRPRVRSSVCVCAGFPRRLARVQVCVIAPPRSCVIVLLLLSAHFPAGEPDVRAHHFLGHCGCQPQPAERGKFLPSLHRAAGCRYPLCT